MFLGRTRVEEYLLLHVPRYTMSESKRILFFLGSEEENGTVRWLVRSWLTMKNDGYFSQPHHYAYTITIILPFFSFIYYHKRIKARSISYNITTLTSALHVHFVWFLCASERIWFFGTFFRWLETEGKYMKCNNEKRIYSWSHHITLAVL